MRAWTLRPEVDRPRSYSGLGVAVAIGRAVFAVERRGDGIEDDTVLLDRADQPELWALVDEVARDLDVAPPDTLRLVDDVNAFVHQDTRLLGLLGGARHMSIGTGLLQVLSVDQLRGVVAHELGHYGGGDTRLSSLVYRASATIGRTVLHLGPESLLGGLFARYARLYQRVSLAVRRRQELHAADAAWTFFGSSYVVPLRRAGTAPRDLYAGYRALLADPLRQQQVADVRSDAGTEPGHPYDSHPSLPARIAHAATLPDRRPPGDTRPARTLLREPQAVEQRVTAVVNQRALCHVPDELYEFGPSLDAAPYVAGHAEDVAVLARAAAALDGGPYPAGLGRTLALLEHDRDVELVTALTGDRRELGEQARQTDLVNLVTGPVARAAELALVRGGAASWQASWSGPVVVVDHTAEPLDLVAVLGEALEAGGPSAVRTALERLGVELADDAVPDEATDEPEQGVIAVWPEVRRGRTWFDLLVTPDELVVVRQRGSIGASLLRGATAHYGIGKGRRRRRAEERLHELLSVPVQDLTGREDVHVVRWDELESVVLRRGIANAWVLRLPRPEPLDRLKADDLLAPSPEATARLLHRLVGPRLDTNVD